MGKIYDAIDEKIASWMSRQRMFFVATAPLGKDTLVNCSPKGGTLHVLGPNELAYTDWDGSGIETVAHVKENGRIVIMMCAFEGPTKIFRFHGRGEVIEPGHEEFDTLRAKFPEEYCRAIIRIHVSRISDSCGYGVPSYQYLGERKVYDNFMKQVTPEKLREYRRENETSLDGLPGLKKQLDE